MKTLYGAEHGILSPMAVSPSKESGEAVMLSGSEYELLLLELPPVKNDQLALTLQYRLRTLYPGDPADTVYGVVPGGQHSRLGAVVVMKRDQLDAWRTVTAKRPLLVSASLLARLCTSRGRVAGAVWSQRFCESAVFEAGRLVSFMIHPAGSDPENRLRTIEEQAQGCEAIHIALSDDAGAERPLIRDLTPSVQIPCMLSMLGDAMRQWDGDALAAFPELPSQTSIPNRLIHSALPWICALLCIGAVVRYGNLRSQDRDTIKYRYEQVNQTHERAEKVRQTLKELEARYALTQKNTEPSVYELIAAIASSFSEKCRMTSLEITGSEFRFEAEGVNSLSIIAAMEVSRKFSDLVLHSATTLESGVERFVVSGRYANAGT